MMMRADISPLAKTQSTQRKGVCGDAAIAAVNHVTVASCVVTACAHAFGNQRTAYCIINEPENAPRYTFSTKEYLPAAGLYLHQYRVYDPIAGRWTQRDPIDYQDSINLYQFCGNNPANAIDTDGQYGRDVHYDLTYKLAIHIGIRPDIAQQIATHNEAVDHGRTDPIARPFQNNNPHFQQYAGKMRRDEIYEEAKQAARNQDAEAFGRKLHEYQDTYAHEGYRPPLGHLIDWTAPDYYDRTDSSGRDARMRSGTARLLRFWLRETKRAERRQKKGARRR